MVKGDFADISNCESLASPAIGQKKKKKKKILHAKT